MPVDRSQRFAQKSLTKPDLTVTDLCKTNLNKTYN